MSTTGTSTTSPLARSPSQLQLGGYGMQYQSHNHPGDEDFDESNNPDQEATDDGPGIAPVIRQEDVEERALQMAIEEVWQDSGRKHRPWGANGRATRMGEVVLLVDSDTVVPAVRFVSFVFGKS
jgi:hypothetical protein